MPGVGSGAGLGLCCSFPDHGITSFPSFSRGDQCFTHNLTYLEVTVGSAALVKHGEQHGLVLTQPMVSYRLRLTKGPCPCCTLSHAFYSCLEPLWALNISPNPGAPQGSQPQPQ